MNPVKTELSAQPADERSPVTDEDDSDDPDHLAEGELRKPSVDECCRNMCLARFDDDFKSSLKSDLSRLSRTEKLIYLFSMLSVNEKVRGRQKGTTKSSKHFEYIVKEYGVPRPVCKTAFITMHDTTPGMVRNLCVKMAGGYLIPTDQRGKHERQPTISEQTKELIKSHFSETLQSNTIFQCMNKNKGRPNIHKLWQDFTKKYEYVSRSTYTKYISAMITPDVLKQFLSAHEAVLILETIHDYEEKYKI